MAHIVHFGELLTTYLLTLSNTYDSMVIPMNTNTIQYNETELISTITSKGQVTVPVQIRRFLGLKPKAKVAFLQKKDGVHIAVPRYTMHTIKGSVPALSQKYSEKEIRDIAIESHLEKYKAK